MQNKVITYGLAYVDGSVTLCEEHTGWDGFGATGPVRHGLHVGACDACIAAGEERYHAADRERARQPDLAEQRGRDDRRAGAAQEWHRVFSDLYVSRDGVRLDSRSDPHAVRVAQAYLRGYAEEEEVTNA